MGASENPSARRETPPGTLNVAARVNVAVAAFGFGLNAQPFSAGKKQFDWRRARLDRFDQREPHGLFRIQAPPPQIEGMISDAALPAEPADRHAAGLLLGYKPGPYSRRCSPMSPTCRSLRSPNKGSSRAAYVIVQRIGGMGRLGLSKTGLADHRSRCVKSLP